MHLLHVDDFVYSFRGLPRELRMAWIGHKQASSTMMRLTENVFAFRVHSGTGPWVIGTLEELLPVIQSLPVPTPYTPPQAPPAQNVDDLLKDLGL